MNQLNKIIRRSLLNCRGNIQADLFAMLLLVFMGSTFLLLTTSHESGIDGQKESNTPTINLPGDNQDGLPLGRSDAVALSAKKNSSGSVDFYVEEKKTTLNGVSSLLKNMGANRVELRLDEDLTNAVTIKILGQLKKAGVKEIAYVFTIVKN